MGAEGDTDHYLMVANVRERLAAQAFDLERLNLRKLNELKVKNQDQIKISNTFAALENLRYREYINRAWKNIKENIKHQLKSLGLGNLKQHTPRFDEERYRFLDQRKQAKI